MPRYKLTLEYDGSSLHGWQRQQNGPSVQEHLVTAFEKFCGEVVDVVGAGRTDAGVHATGQVAHVDLARDFAPYRVQCAVNFHLQPARIAIRHAEIADGEFHARFSAKERRYGYRIVNRQAPLALDFGRAWHVWGTLDAARMHEAAQLLVGHHDFSTFRASICQAKSPVKTLDLLAVRREGEEVRIEAAARSFLHHQVRNIAGSLVMVGLGKWTRDDLQNALMAKDRKAGGPTAPACGLYLEKVEY